MTSKSNIILEICAFLIVITFVVSVVSQTPSQLRIYSDSNAQNSRFYIYTQVNEPDTESHANLNTTNGAYHYVCATGVWIFYFQPNYTSLASPPWGGNGSDFVCHQGYSYKSLRHIGLAEDITVPALNLYVEMEFRGEEILVLEDTPTFNGKYYLSATRTSNVFWTLYGLPNYSGSSRCLNATYQHSVGFAVGSAKKGC